MDFQITSNDLKAFRELMKNAPFAMQKVTANALNALGASLKVEIVKTLGQTMTIRNKSWAHCKNSAVRGGEIYIKE